MVWNRISFLPLQAYWPPCFSGFFVSFFLVGYTAAMHPQVIDLLDKAENNALQVMRSRLEFH